MGGSVLRDAEGYARVAEKIKERFIESQTRIVVVVSAMRRVTDLLLKALEGNLGAYDVIKEKHLLVAQEFGSNSLKIRIENSLETLKKLLDNHNNITPSLSDYILSFGERLSKLFLTEALRNAGINAIGLNAIELIRTDETHGNASIKYKATEARLRNYVIPLINYGLTPVIEGFIGSSMNGEVTTLGRGGSDYTATAVASLLSADEVYLITDVPGIMSVDPRYVSSAVVIDRLSYAEGMEASLYGCKNLHLRAFHPLMSFYQSKIRVGNWDAGTIIDSAGGLSAKRPKLLAFKVKSGLAHIAVIGEGINHYYLIKEITDLLLHEGINYEGMIAFRGRPSITLVVRVEDLKRTLYVLHNLIVGWLGNGL